MAFLNGYTNRILNGQFCKADRSFNTTYNNDKNVPPFVGIMFEVSSFIDIEITTFEVDIRWDLKPTDLSIQVFTIEGPYANRFNHSSAWDKLASTEIVAVPEGNSGVIPASDFTPVSIKAFEVRSFYITMTGPYIDHTVYGLQKTGDIHTKGDDLQLYVGSGFTSDNFPGQIDKILDPQFAGIVYYKKSYQCNDNEAKSTTITFQFVLDAKGIDDSFVLSYNTALDMAIDSFMATNESMQIFIQNFGLHKNMGATTVKESYGGECPEDWKECAPIIFRSTLRFSHMNALETSKIQFELYSENTAIKVIDTIRETLQTDRSIANVGIVSTSARLQVRTKSLYVGKIIDEIQTRYFEDTTRRFLDRFTGAMAVFNAALKVELSQNETRKLRRHLSDGADSNGIVTFTFDVNGAYPVGASMGDYIDAINTACQAQSDVFVSMLKNNGIRPGDISEGDRLEYFQGINSVSCEINKADKLPIPTAPTTDGALIRNVTIAVLFSVSVCLTTMYAIWRISTSRKRSEEEAKVREERRKERRLKRMERSNEEASIRSIDLRPIHDLEGVDTDSIDQCSMTGLLNKKRVKSSDSTSSISLSLHSLDLEPSPHQSSKSVVSNSSKLAEKQNSRPSDQKDSLENKLVHSSKKSNVRSKSLSPTLQAKRNVDSNTLGRSLDLSMMQIDMCDSDNGSQQSTMRIIQSKLLGQSKQLPPSSCGCVTVHAPAAMLRNHTSGKLVAGEESSDQPKIPRSKYKPPPISQHRDPSLRRIDIEKSQYQLQQIAGMLPKSSSRSLDGLSVPKENDRSRKLVGPPAANNKPSPGSICHRPMQTKEQFRGNERLHRSLDLSGINISNDLNIADSETKRSIRQSARSALCQNLDLSKSYNSKMIRNAPQEVKSDLHKSPGLTGRDVSKNAAKVNRRQQPSNFQNDDSDLQRSLDLDDVDLSRRQDQVSEARKPIMRQASNPAPHRTFRTNERLHRSLDLTVDVADNHESWTRGSKPSNGQRYAVTSNGGCVSLTHKNTNCQAKRSNAQPVNRALDRKSDFSGVVNSCNNTNVKHGTIPNIRQVSNPMLHRSKSDIGSEYSKVQIKKPNSKNRTERLDMKSSLGTSDHGSVQDVCKSAPTSRIKNCSGGNNLNHQPRSDRNPVKEITKAVDGNDQRSKLNDSNKPSIKHQHSAPPSA